MPLATFTDDSPSSSRSSPSLEKKAKTKKKNKERGFGATTTLGRPSPLQQEEDDVNARKIVEENARGDVMSPSRACSEVCSGREVPKLAVVTVVVCLCLLAAAQVHRTWADGDVGSRQGARARPGQVVPQPILPPPTQFQPQPEPSCDRGQTVSVMDFGAVGDGFQDDTAAVLAALQYGAGCKAAVVIGPGKREFYVMPNGIQVELHDVAISFQGFLVGPALNAWSGTWPEGSCAYADKKCPKRGGPSPEFARSHWSLLHLTGSHIVIEGDGGLRAPGETFWSKRNSKPSVRGYCLLKLENCSDVRITGINVWDSPMYHVVVMMSQGVMLDRLNLLGRQASIKNAKNTDGVSIIASQQVRLTNSVIASGDDNIVVKEGTSDFVTDNVTLINGKGISIGSLGERGADNQVVKNVHFSNVHVQGSMHCSRIKTWVGATGLVQDVSFRNFECKVMIGILIDQNYCPSSQRPEGCSKDTHRAIDIDNVVFENFSGTYSKQLKVQHCRKCTNVEYTNIALAKK